MKRNKGPQTGTKGQTRSFGERKFAADGPSHSNEDIGASGAKQNQVVPGRHNVSLVPSDCHQFDQHTGVAEGNGDRSSGGKGGIIPGGGY